MENGSSLNRIDRFLSEYLGALILAIVVMVVPITIYAIPTELPLSQAVLIGQSSPYDLYCVSKVVVLFGLISLMSITFVSDYIWKKKKFSFSIVMVIPIALLILNAIAVMFSEYKFQAVFGQYDRYEGFITQGLYVLLFIFSSIYIQRQNTFKLLMMGLAVSSVVLSIVGIFQAMGFNLFRSVFFQEVFFKKALDLGVKVRFPDSSVAYAMLGNPNHVGSFTALAFPLFFACLWKVKNKIKKYILRGILIILWMFFLFSKSTGGYLGLISGMLIFIYIGKRYFKIKLVRMCVEILFVLLAGFMLCMVLSPSTIQTTNHSIFRTSDQDFYLNRIDFEQGSASFTWNENHRWKALIQEGKLEYHGNEDRNLKYKQEAHKIYFENPAYQIFDHELFHHENAVELHFLKRDFSIFTDGKIFWYQKGLITYYDLNQIPHLPLDHMEKWGSGRMYIWSRTLPLLKGTLLIGKGPDTFMLQFPQQDLIGKINTFWNPRTIVDKPHNYYLMVATTTGVLGLLVFLFVLIVIFKFLMKAIIEGSERYELLGILCALIGFLTVMMVNDSIIPVMVPFWCIMGTALGLTLKQNQIEQQNKNEVLE